MNTTCRLFYVLLLACVCWSPALADICGLSSCTCYTKYEGVLVVCRSSLADVPSWPPDTRQYWNISLADNRITDLKADAFSGLQTHTLDLSGNSLLSISAFAFRGLSVQRLIIESDTISLLPNQAFTQIPQLRELVMKNFELSTLQVRAFSMLPQLKLLQLEGCRLQYIDVGAFNGLNVLETLKLNNNLLRTVPRLGDVQQLRRLDLSHNDISSISAKQFSALNRLELLDLSRNNLNSFAVDSFFGAIADSLTTLCLDNNGLTSESLDIIRDLRNLTKLTLNYNKITSIKNVLFAHLSRLKILELRNNELSLFDEDVFQYATHLEYLDLSNNFIASLSSQIFYPLTNLATMILDDQHSFNLSSSMHSLLFKSQRSTLRHLSLSRLQLDDNVWMSLDHLSQLHYLSLTENKLRSIGSLTGCTSLKHLHLGSNLIVKLDRQDFDAVSLTSLSLANNSVYSIGHCFLDLLPDLELINLNQNTLKCDCHLMGLYQWMSLNPSSFPRQWRCSSPAELSGEVLANLHEDQLVCTDGTSVEACLTTTSSTTSTTTTTTTSSTSSITTTSSTTKQTTLAETTTATSTTTSTTITPHIPISINIMHTSTDSISLSWSHVNEDIDFRGYRVVVKHGNLTVRVSELLLEPRFSINKLQSGTEYGLCVEVEFSRRIYRTSVNCIRASTQQRHEADTVSAGVAAGVAVTLSVLILAVFVVCLYLQRRRKPVPVISQCTRWYKKQRSQESQRQSQQESQLQQFNDKQTTQTTAQRYVDKQPVAPTMPLPPTPDERGYNSSGATCATKDSAYGSVYWEIDNDDPRPRGPLTAPHHVHADSSATQVYPASSISDGHSTDVRVHSELSSPVPPRHGNVLTFGKCKLYSDTGILV